MSKYFYDKNIQLVNQQDEIKVFDDNISQSLKTKVLKEKNKKVAQLKAPKGRVIISVDLDYKNSHQLTKDIKIRLERDVEQLNYRIKMPTNATIIYAENIPIGAEVIINHNATHPVNLINDFDDFDGDLISSEIAYFSIPETDCYIWRMDGETEWKPCKNFIIGERVYKKYDGLLEDVKGEELKNYLYVTSEGKFKGKIVKTLHAALYQMHFQEKNGRESSLIRCRHFPDEEDNPREEIIAIDNEKTKLKKEGKIICGLSYDTAK